MRLLSSFWERLRSARATARRQESLREFVYLDDVSVQSLLASRRGGIATEFTTSQRTSLNSEVSGSAGIGIGATSGRAESRVGVVDAQTSQVVSKAVIQTSFKELYEIERGALTLGRPGAGKAPRCSSSSGLLGLLDSKKSGAWLVDAATLRRGALVELEIELEADPIFHMATVVSTFRDLFEDNEQLFGSDLMAQVPQMKSIASVLDALLSGLVPVRGRLVDYEAASVSGREVLIHRRVLDQGAREQVECLRPVYLVGVAERDLFWRDIRRVLFSGARYTSFCRVAREGLVAQWHPVKVANVLGGIVPDFDQLIVDFSHMAREAVLGAGDSRTFSPREVEREKEVVEAYAKLLAEHHGAELTPTMAERIAESVGGEREWLRSVDQRRSVMGKVTEVVEEALGVQQSIDPGERYRLRIAALAEVGLVGAFATEVADGRARPRSVSGASEEVYLETEIVGLYW